MYSTGEIVPKFPYQMKKYDIDSNNLSNYLIAIADATRAFESNISPLLEPFFEELAEYEEALRSKIMDIDYSNPMIYTNKIQYALQMLLINQSNRFWRRKFDTMEKKIIVLPRCLTGPQFNLLKVKRTKLGWHRIIDTQEKENKAWILTQMSKDYNFEVFITMGNKFKEPSFLRVFQNLKKKYGSFGLIAVACIPELAFGNTYIMEIGIPSHGVPLFYSGCLKWHGKSAIKTEFPLNYILDVLSL